MLRTTYNYKVEDSEAFKRQLLIWSQQFDDVVWLDSNHNKGKYGSYDAILAVDALTSIQTDYSNGFEKLKEYQSNVKDWIFGYLTYDLKNDLEWLQSNNHDGLQFPDLYFFQPKKLFFIKGNTVKIKYLNAVHDVLEEDLLAIEKSNVHYVKQESDPVKIKLRIHKDEYFKKLDLMLAHIFRGDIYEANFCYAFQGKNVEINPLAIYQKLNSKTLAPFSVYGQFENHFILSASPERFIKKQGLKIISQQAIVFIPIIKVSTKKLLH